MKVIYDAKKADKLQKERDIDLEEVAVLISRKEYLDVIPHGTNAKQRILVVDYKGYIHAIPCLLEGQDGVVIKTMYKSRKLNKKYGGKK